MANEYIPMTSELGRSSYPVRTSYVGRIDVIDVALSAVLQLGDRGETNASLWALAVQRQEAHSAAGEAYFESYPMFSRSRPILNDPAYDANQVIELERINCKPHISVGCLRILAVSSAASLLIGNEKRLTAESRIKHIRQFAQPVASAGRPIQA